MQQPERASPGSRRSSIRERLPGPSRSASFPSQGSNRLTEQLRRKPPFPPPHRHSVQATWRRRSLAGCKNKQTKRATFSRITQANGEKQHSRPLWTLREPLIRSPGRRAAQSPVLHGSRITCTLRTTAWRPRSAARREPSAAQSEEGRLRPQVRTVHFWVLQDQQKPEKAPGMRSSDWPTRAWVGEGGGGQKRGGRWKI